MEDDALRPVISIVAQSVSIELILLPEMRHSRPALFKQAKKALGIQSRRVGSPRKSAAIIPFVNETVISGLPIGSGKKCLRIGAVWVSTGMQRAGEREIRARRRDLCIGPELRHRRSCFQETV